MRFDIPPKPWDGLKVWEIAEAIWCSPDSHRDTVVKRIRLLREQGHHEFAELVESSFDLSDEAAARHDAFVDALTSWGQRLIEE
jgi:hypothetical protein